MGGAYNLLIEQANYPIPIVLSFPVEIPYLVNGCFQPTYQTGHDFLADLKQAELPMLELIVANALGPEPNGETAAEHSGKNFRYGIEQDKLTLSITVAHGPGGTIIPNLAYNEWLALDAAACFMPNRMLIKRAIAQNPDNGPIYVTGTRDEQISGLYTDMGAVAMQELGFFLGSLERYLLPGKSGRPKPHIEGNFIRIKPILINKS